MDRERERLREGEGDRGRGRETDTEERWQVRRTEREPFILLNSSVTKSITKPSNVMYQTIAGVLISPRLRMNRTWNQEGGCQLVWGDSSICGGCGVFSVEKNIWGQELTTTTSGVACVLLTGWLVTTATRKLSSIIQRGALWHFQTDMNTQSE